MLTAEGGLRDAVSEWDVCVNPACFPLGTSLEDFVQAAHAAGFRHVEVSIQQALQLGQRLGGMKVIAARLADAGMCVEQFSGLLPDGPILPAPLLITGSDWLAALATLDERLEAAALLGCRRAEMTCNPRSVLPAAAAHTLAIERLSVLAGRAATYGIRLAVEFIGIQRDLPAVLDGPHLFVASLPAVVSLLNEVDGSNLGLLLDTCHLYASGAQLDDLCAIPPGAVEFLQVSDVPSGVLPDAMTDSFRCLPGEGALPIHVLLETVAATGYQGPASIELFSPELWALDPAAIAARLHAAAIESLRMRPLGAAEGGS